MERTRDTLLLALYALPDPPDGMLVRRRAAAAKEQDGGAAASRAGGDATPRGRGGGAEAGVSLDVPRVDSRMDDPARKGRRCNGGGAAVVVVEEVSCEGAAPHDNRSLDATRKGCGAIAAGSALVDEQRCTRGSKGCRPCGGVVLDPDLGNHRLEATWKGCGAGYARQRSLVDKHHCSNNSEEEVPCPGCALDRLPLNRHLDATDALVVPCSRGANTVTCCSDDCGQPFSGSGQSHRGEPLTGQELKADVHAGSGSMISRSSHASCHCSSNARADCHPSHSLVTEIDDDVNFQADLGAGARYKSASASKCATSNVDRYDPVPELLLCDGEVLSQPWRQIWLSTPLVLHDKRIARYFSPRGIVFDLTEKITSILEKHPGNVAYFRLDSTRWTGGRTQLSEWLKALSQKNACEIIVVNRVDDPRFEFPLEDVRSSCLKSLRLGFFSLSDLDLQCFEYNNLDTLDLMGCAFETNKLYHVVKECQNLTHLGIGLAKKDVRIHSESLQHLQIWRCSMIHMSVEYAPRLQLLVHGVRPAWKGQSVLVMIKHAPALHEFENLLLPYHKVEDRLWLGTLKKIKLGIQMDCHSQRKLLCELLHCASTLEELLIWRMDEIGISEELDVLIDDSMIKLSAGLPCFKSLQIFQIEDFRGGGSESAIAAAILKYAVNLKDLQLLACRDSCEETARKAYMALLRVKRASVNCSIELRDYFLQDPKKIGGGG